MQIPLSKDGDRLSLRQGQTLSRRLHAPVRVRVRCGLVWLTVEQGGADVWLSPGRDFDFHGRGLAVFEAVKGCAELELAPLPGRWSTMMRGLGAAPARASSAAPPSAPARIARLLPRGLIRWF